MNVSNAPEDAADALCNTANDIVQWMWRIVGAVIIVFGLFGNTIVVVVFSRLHFTRSSTLLHMFVLAINDSVVLCVGPLRYWMLNAFDYDLRLISDAGCKLMYFLLYQSLDFSAWILVSVSVERACSVLKPLHVRRWFTVRRAIIRLVLIFVVLSGINMHFFFTNGLIAEEDGLGESEGAGDRNMTSGSALAATTSSSDNVTGSDETSTVRAIVSFGCDSLSPDYEHFEDYIFVWIDLCFDSLFPLIIMAVCNIFIISSLHHSARPRRTTRRQLFMERNSHLAENGSAIQHNSELSANPRNAISKLSKRKGKMSKRRVNSERSNSARRNNSERSNLARRNNSERSNSGNRNNSGRKGVAHSGALRSKKETTSQNCVSNGSAKTLSEPALPSLSADESLQSDVNNQSPADAHSGHAETVHSDPAPFSGVTRLLVLVTFVFFVTTLPNSLYYIVDSFLYNTEISCSRTNAVMDIVNVVTNLLQYSNYGSNFLLYSARSRRFWLEVRRMFGLANHRFRRHFQSSVLSGTISTRVPTSARVLSTKGHKAMFSKANRLKKTTANGTLVNDPSIVSTATSPSSDRTTNVIEICDTEESESFAPNSMEDCSSTIGAWHGHSLSAGSSCSDSPTSGLKMDTFVRSDPEDSSSDPAACISALYKCGESKSVNPPINPSLTSGLIADRSESSDFTTHNSFIRNSPTQNSMTHNSVAHNSQTQNSITQTAHSQDSKIQHSVTQNYHTKNSVTQNSQTFDMTSSNGVDKNSLETATSGKLSENVQASANSLILNVKVDTHYYENPGFEMSDEAHLQQIISNVSRELEEDEVDVRQSSFKLNSDLYEKYKSSENCTALRAASRHLFPSNLQPVQTSHPVDCLFCIRL